MLELIKFFLEKLDFLKIAEFLRKRNNRVIAARLHLVLVYSYEIIEIYRVILDELKAALQSHESHDDKHCFYINPARVAGLLRRQASNLEILDQLSADLIKEIVILDSRFEQTFRQIIPGKAGILFDAQLLLADGRLPLNEDDAHHFPAAADGTYRTLWFTRDAPKQDRQEIRKYLYGWTGTEKKVVDVNIHDGDEFFRLLSWYLENNRPYEQIENLERVAASYRQALIENFTLEEILSDIGSLRRHSNWAR